jgi:hypothetical protein
VGLTPLADLAITLVPQHTAVAKEAVLIMSECVDKLMYSRAVPIPETSIRVELPSRSEGEAITRRRPLDRPELELPSAKKTATTSKAIQVNIYLLMSSIIVYSVVDIILCLSLTIIIIQFRVMIPVQRIKPTSNTLC